jgi:hypothetical protein
MTLSGVERFGASAPEVGKGNCIVPKSATGEQQAAEIQAGATRSLSRRSVLQGAIGSTGLALSSTQLTSAQGAATPPAATPEAQSDEQVRVFPMPESVTASPGTQLSFRGPGLSTARPIEVIGSESGVHPGVEVPHSDGNGVSWMPDFAFHAGEEVTVSTRLDIVGARKGDFSFTISTPRPLAANPRRNKKPEDGQVHHFRSRPGLAPQVFEVKQHGEPLAPGYLFVAPKEGAGRNGALIMDNRGEPVWFFPVEAPVDQILDFRVQELDGEPVLTWWQGVVVRGHGFGHWMIRDQAYTEIGTIRIGNGYAGGDLHELVLTRQRTALVGAYSTIAWDLHSMGGKKDGSIIDCIVQEIDIGTGAVIFEWHSLDHVALDETYDKSDEGDDADALDQFHFNAITLDSDDNLVISARNTWAAYKVDRTTGEVIWRLNGKASDFKVGDGADMAYQHDVRHWPNGEVTLFDNGGSPQVHDESRGLVLKLDMDKMTAEVVREYLHPDHIFAGSQGNFQTLPNGNVLIGWGSEPIISEFSYDGELLCDWRMFEDKQTYRAYKFEWTGTPADFPIVAVERDSRDKTSAYVSWNGATAVDAWQLLAGDDQATLTPVGDPVPHAGFETAISVAGDSAFVAVQALSADGVVLATSKSRATSE